MTEYRYQKPLRIFLLGGGKLMGEFAGWLQGRGYAVGGYTAERQHAETEAAWPKDNRHLSVGPPKDFVTRRDDLFLCFGPAWPISAWLTKQNSHRLLDFMSIPFPAYQGGAHETWATLNGQKTWGCCMQLVTENTRQGECHDGEVIFAENFPFAEREARHLEFLKRFIERIEKGGTFTTVTSSLPPVTFPRLNTERNGWIDWSWNVSEIGRFLNAFAAYGGASTYLGDQVVRLGAAESWAESVMHPYCAGLVLDVQGTTARIACRNGSARIVLGFPVKPGDRLHTPRAKLEEALLYRPTYDAKGDGKCPPEMNLAPAQQPATAAFLQVDPLSIELLTEAHVTDEYVGWLNDPEVIRYLEVRHYSHNRSTIFDFISKCRYDGQALFGIFLNDRHIGNLKIGPVNPHHRHADISYFIGAKDLWGKGYATKAVNLAVGWAFQHMKVHRLQAGTYASNIASGKVLLRAGFHLEATLKQQLLLDGQWVDHHLYAKINPDWKP